MLYIAVNGRPAASDRQEKAAQDIGVRHPRTGQIHGVLLPGCQQAWCL